HTRFSRDWSSDVCSSDLIVLSGSPLHAELLQRAFLDFHELGLDLHLADIVVTVQDGTDALQVAIGLGDDDRGTVIGQAGAGGIEIGRASRREGGQSTV